MMGNDIKKALLLYAQEGIPTGDFLRAVLENNLMEAMGRADEYNRLTLFDICSFVYNELPSPCHGSPKKVTDWIESKRAKREKSA